MPFALDASLVLKLAVLLFAVATVRIGFLAGDWPLFVLGAAAFLGASLADFYVARRFGLVALLVVSLVLYLGILIPMVVTANGFAAHALVPIAIGLALVLAATAGLALVSALPDRFPIAPRILLALSAALFLVPTFYRTGYVVVGSLRNGLGSYLSQAPGDGSRVLLSGLWAAAGEKAVELESIVDRAMPDHAAELARATWEFEDLLRAASGRSRYSRRLQPVGEEMLQRSPEQASEKVAKAIRAVGVDRADELLIEMASKGSPDDLELRAIVLERLEARVPSRDDEEEMLCKFLERAQSERDALAAKLVVLLGSRPYGPENPFRERVYRAAAQLARASTRALLGRWIATNDLLELGEPAYPYWTHFFEAAAASPELRRRVLDTMAHATSAEVMAKGWFLFHLLEIEDLPAGDMAWLRGFLRDLHAGKHPELYELLERAAESKNARVRRLVE